MPEKENKSILHDLNDEFRISFFVESKIDRSDISAVFLVCFSENKKILITRNVRGIDIPGGHVLKGESLENAVVRETLEETGVRIDPNKITPFALIETMDFKYKGKKMWFAVTNLKVNAKNKKLIRKFCSVKKFLSLYSQKEYRGVIESILNKALDQ